MKKGSSFLALFLVLFGILMGGCQPQPITPGSFTFENWTTGKTGRLKYVGKVYSPDGTRLVEYANVAVKSNGSFSYSLRTPSTTELSPLDVNSIISTCSVSDKTVRVATGEAILTVDGSTTKYSVTISNKSPDQAYTSGTKVINQAVYINKPLTVSKTCRDSLGNNLNTDVVFTGGKWNYLGYNGTTIYGREKIGDPDLRAWKTQVSTLSTTSTGNRALAKPLKFIR